MSTKRSWDEVGDHTESNDVSVSYGCPDCVVTQKSSMVAAPTQDTQPSRQGNKSKRAKLTRSIKPLNRSRSSWGRLGAFCSKWIGFLLTTNNYHRKPVVTAGKEIRLEIRHTASIPFTAYIAITLKDEILIFGECEETEFINVYDRTNLTEPKAVIPLEDIDTQGIEACNVSNCVYLVVATPHETHIIVRLTKDDRQFNISPPLISNLHESWLSMNVSANGNIVITFPVEIAVYNSSGSLLHKVVLSANVYGVREAKNVVQKSNGNLVVQSIRLPSGQDMMELDTTGRIVYQHQSPNPSEFIYGSFVDAYDKTFMCYQSRIDVLDQEFNALRFAGTRPDIGRQPGAIDTWYYDRERHEAIRLSTDDNYENGVLSIFHIEEQ